MDPLTPKVQALAGTDIILDRDIFSCDVYDIGETEVLLTLLAGREMYRSERLEG